MQYRIPDQTPAGWLARLLGAVVGVIVMIGLFFLGLTIFAAAAGLAILVAVIVAIRIWWLRRRLRARARRGDAANDGNRPPGQGVTLEGEYEERRRR